MQGYLFVCMSAIVLDSSRGVSNYASLSFVGVLKPIHVGARQAKKDSPLENPMVDRASQVLVWGSVVGTVAIAAVSL